MVNKRSVNKASRDLSGFTTSAFIGMTSAFINHEFNQKYAEKMRISSKHSKCFSVRKNKQTKERCMAKYTTGIIILQSNLLV